MQNPKVGLDPEDEIIEACVITRDGAERNHQKYL